MFWTFGRNLYPASAPSGMTRYDARLRSVYRGAFTSVLPASPSTVSVVDHDDMHFLYRVEVRPAQMDHKNDSWLAVLDASDSPQKVTAISSIPAINADAMQLSDSNHTVVAFSPSNTPSMPIRITPAQQGDAYIVGLLPSTNYTVTLSRNELTVSPDDGTHRFMSTEAGVLRVPHP